MNKVSRTLIGLMSGMSMDGVDLALVKISGTPPNLKIDLLDSYYKEYPGHLKKQLEEARAGNVQELSQLDFEVAQIYVGVIEEFLKEKKIKPKKIDAIGSHGQTIRHSATSTLQIGSGAVIAKKTGICTVSNFRKADMAAGGKGAPLVPLVDYYLYSKPGQTIAMNNLGSISNVTVIPPKLEDVMAFDTGPANMPIDFFARQVLGNRSGIDEDGQYSAKGKVDMELLKYFMAIPFLKLSPPKAAGYDEFGPKFLAEAQQRFSKVSTQDCLRTSVEFSAQSIADAYKKFILPKYPNLKSVVFTGGGAYNKTLMKRIKELLPNLNISVMTEKDPKFSDAKEALCFAVLANETLLGRPGNVPGATGAREAVVLGEISL